MPEPTTACLWPLTLPAPRSLPAHFIDGRAEPASGDRTRIWLLKAEGPEPPGGGAGEGAPLAGWRVRGSWVQAAPSPFPSRDLCVWGRYPKIVAVGGGPVWSEIPWPWNSLLRRLMSGRGHRGPSAFSGGLAARLGCSVFRMLEGFTGFRR